MTEEQISKVYLLDVPLENDYQHTLYFTSKEEQQSYFQSRIKHSFSDFSYQRKDSFIRVPLTFDDAYKINYVMYQNPKYSNKWFYAFVTEVKWENDEVSSIYIETDVIQTWLFDYNVKSSFVEREHVTDDTVGLHTVPEGLETGPYVMCSNPTKINHYESTTYICIASSELFEEIPVDDKYLKREYNGIYSGLYYLVCTSPDQATKVLNIYDKKGKADAVYSVFHIPAEFIQNISNLSVILGTAEGISYNFYLMQQTKTPVNLLRNESLEEIEYKEITINSKLSGGYTPKNNKLFTAEYNYMVLTNNAGSDVPLSYEDFVSNKPRFKVVGAITPGCSIKCIPINYKTIDTTDDIENSFNYGINGAKFPICSYSSDAYTNWLNQNGLNIALNIAGGVTTAVGGIALGVATGGVGFAVGGGAAVGGISQVVNALAQIHKQSIVPDQARGNVNSGDVTYSAKNCVFSIYQMSIKKEYAQMIDGYFSAYGYKVNMYKVPNKAHRSRWWYTKTINVNIDGAIPNTDMQKIKDCYNNGITFWRNASEIQNYSLSNSIV